MKFKVDPVVINNCNECSHYNRCTNQKTGKSRLFCDLSSKKLDNYGVGIPDWCELTDYEGNQFLNKVIDKIRGKGKQKTT